MEELKAHPNTQAVLAAWRRLSLGQVDGEGPSTNDYPGLIGRLFVLTYVDEADFSFRRSGYGLDKLFGRQLAEHNFLSLWGASDRNLVAAALGSALADNGPTLIKARGESLDGRRIDLEFALAPLAPVGTTIRFLGLCQSLTPVDVLGGRPLRRLQAVAVFPPAPLAETPTIRIVSSR